MAQDRHCWATWRSAFSLSRAEQPPRRSLPEQQANTFRNEWNDGGWWPLQTYTYHAWIFKDYNTAVQNHLGLLLSPQQEGGHSVVCLLALAICLTVKTPVTACPLPVVISSHCWHSQFLLLLLSGAVLSYSNLSSVHFERSPPVFLVSELITAFCSWAADGYSHCCVHLRCVF